MTGHAVELQTVRMSAGYWRDGRATFIAQCTECPWHYETTMRDSRDAFARAHSIEKDPDFEPEAEPQHQKHRVTVQQLWRHPDGLTAQATCACGWDAHGTPREVHQAVAGHVTNHRKEQQS